LDLRLHFVPALSFRKLVKRENGISEFFSL
jgi:hypothetical protein